MATEHNDVDEFTDPSGRRFRPDPTGAARYRMWRKNPVVRFFTGDWSDTVSDGPGHPTRQSNFTADMRAAREVRDSSSGTAQPATYSADSTSTPRWPQSAGDAVAAFLELVGWLVVAGSVIGGLILIRQSSDYRSDVPAELGWVVMLAGVVQGLLLVGFSRIITFTARTAKSSAETADLLRQAIDISD